MPWIFLQPPRTERLVLGLAIVASLLWGRDAEGQTLVDPLVPGGWVRLEVAPTFSKWDTRFGLDEQGGREEALGADLTDPDGRSLFPGIATLQESIRGLTGLGDYQARLGSTSAVVTKDVTRVETGLRVGVFDRLTIGAMVPWVRARTAIDIGFLPGGSAPDLGVSPTASDPFLVDAFLVDLGSASAAARSRADGLCAIPADPACSAAVALADRAATFESRMRAAYGASTFFPLEGSAIATLLDASLSALSAELATAGLAPVGSPMEFSTEALDAARFANIPIDGASGIQASPLRSRQGLWGVGDIEISAALRLLEGGSSARDGLPPRWSYSLTGGVLVRLGTGTMDDPDVFFDVGTGDGQTDVEGQLDGALRLGSRFDVRTGARMGKQGSTTLVRRVVPHEVALAPAHTRRVVRWSPANYTLFHVSPRWHLTDELAFAVDYRRYHKGEDGYEILGEGIPGAPPVLATDLSRETEETLEEVAIGLRFSSRGSWQRGLVGSPIELGARIVTAVAGAGGQTPKTMRAELSLTLFRRLWGSP